MKRFSVGLRDIEQAVLEKTGVNLNLFATKPRFSGIGPKNFVLESSSVWSFKSRGKWATHSGNYRGNWSPYIPRNVILRYSQPGDVVLDQFCGGGTTAVEAKLLGRRCIALDINPIAVDLTRKNLDFTVTTQETLDGTEELYQLFEPSIGVGDARNLEDIADGSVDLICTHPPYADIVRYTDGLEGDLSACNVDRFLEEMQAVADECYRVVKPEGHCAVLIGDMRKKKRVIPLGFRTIELFQRAGFVLKDLIIKRQHNCRTTGFWYTSSVKHNFLLLAQEYLPVFQKTRFDFTGNQSQSAGQFRLRLGTHKVPPPPSEMQCKTTWILPSDDLDAHVDANVMNRYGEGGEILTVDVGLEEAQTQDYPDKEFSLVYATIPVEVSGEELRKLAQDVVSLSEKALTSQGHLVFRVRDFKQGEYTISPALDIWRIPKEKFAIREIVVVAPSEAHERSAANSSLQIVHDHLLVYQKRE
ncbi:MAG: hypothetical protein DRP09_16845 [Candidatus Thorarchaeota archaeon]|nr:MAG: hypothetical protein DRP09_16845 [Candidatus Thorarchaeota archaeon]